MRDQDLLSKFLPMIYRMALTLTGNEPDAQDLAHDTMVAALDSLGRFRSEARLSTWLSSILIHRHRTLRRRHAIRRRLQPKVEAARPTPDAPDPGASSQQSEQEAALKGALDRLEGDERRLVALSIYQELDSTQVGRILGRPAGTVRSQLHEVREKLRRMLERQTHGS